MTTRLLIDCGADVDALNSNRKTPLHLVVQNRTSSNVLEIVDLLCNAGAHLDYVNKNGQTPLQSLRSYRCDMIEYLKEKMSVIRLKCLCARIVRQQQFPIENILCTSLVNFVQKH
jgi:Fem-1 family protein b